MDFEAAFSRFLDRREYDQAESALFSMVRIAFVAGWLSAGGDPPIPQKVLELRPNYCDVLSLQETIETDLLLPVD